MTAAQQVWAFPDKDAVNAMVAGQVRAELARARWSVKHLVRSVGGSYSYWSRRVNGLTPFEVEDLVRVCIALSLGLDDLVPGAAFTPTYRGPDDNGGVGPAGLEPATYGLQDGGFGSNVVDLSARREHAANVVPLRSAA